VRLGIDFGTTHTSVAVADRGNYPVVAFEGPSGDSLDAYPSLVAPPTRPGGAWRFGLDALDLPASTPLLRAFKRSLGRPDATPQLELELGGARIGLLELLVGFLGALRRDLGRSSLGPAAAGARPEAVVATPAIATAAQRFLTLEAFRLAGFDVRAVLGEPAAAGVEFAHRHQRSLSSVRQTVLVYDLGGGTFDASLVDVRDRRHDVIDGDGDPALGGVDFDRALLELVLPAEAARAELSGLEHAALLEACRRGKERIHPSARRVVVEVADALEPETLASLGLAPVVDVPIDAFEAAIEPLVARTVALAEALAARSPEPLAGVYSVGGASALPQVGRALRAVFGRRVHRSPYPAAATAIGLAITGDPSAGVRVAERTSRGVGVFRESASGAAVAFDPIFPPRTSRPEAGARLEAHRRYRAAHNLGHFRFVEHERLAADGAPEGDLRPLGDLRFAFDPALRCEGVSLASAVVERRPSGPLVEERYALLPDGTVEVRITDLDCGEARSLRLGGGAVEAETVPSSRPRPADRRPESGA
jgi:molecular chaperone DnaK (HSP70)